MKDLLSLLAQYNRSANEQLFRILDEAGSEVINKESGSYFGSIMGLLNHILLSDLGWLTGFRDSDIDLPAFDSGVLTFAHPGWRENLYDDLTELKNHRVALDDLFCDFVDETDEKLFIGQIAITKPGRSQTMSFPFGKILLHVFNHQTHHRGAISHILDQNQVDNDYSNLMRLIM
jgi:uncharacterized damage-inducible protein DinB